MSMQRCCPPATVDRTDRSAEAALFKALADPHRLTMLATLARAEDEVCVCDFTGSLPLEQPTVSHHLKILRAAELVTCERRGTWVYYRLAAGAGARIDAALRSVIPEKAFA
jgi:ArsR family transcriptional regulator, arsenate/arsenite/antimonite-responsive transcriptional repressor